MSMEYSKTQLYNKVKPYFLVIIMQFGYAGMSIIGKFALNKGMSEHVFIAYQHAIAAVVIAPFAVVFDRKRTPKLTLCVFAKVALIALLGPVINQNLFYTGMKYTTASFARAMCNVIPAFSFAMAWILGLEKVYLRRLRGQAKVLGTMVTVVGALLMTLVKGPMFNLPWANGNAHQESTSAANKQDITKGALMILASSLSGSGFFILQAITLKSYPAELSLTVLICLMGSLESTILALAIEWGNPTAWSIHFDIKLLATIYSGLICSGFAFYIQGVVMKERGPVFVTAFSPLSVVLVMIIGSFILSETLHIGRVIGAVVIIVGLYLVLWGKSKDQLESTSDSNKFGYAGLSIIVKFALNQGMNHYVLVAYRMPIATAVIAPFAIVLESPVLDQNLFYLGMRYTDTSFTSAMCNILPAFAFFMAWIFRLEMVNIRKGRNPHDQSASDAQKQDLIKGALIIIASCFFWSCFIILQVGINAEIVSCQALTYYFDLHFGHGRRHHSGLGI
ncbi:hypothetical protein CMV_015018 [Castanea mollissima]|uniref:EamA domain-containing protein n=1 Tax=Castanea mollissima TaxID=60419 RepID=A0A8J4VKF4_9ROSI|nr:hypothetical protein CMV_015018 [Castanea mollissima]